jgi:hypothetical protein
LVLAVPAAACCAAFTLVTCVAADAAAFFAIVHCALTRSRAAAMLWFALVNWSGVG